MNRGVPPTAPNARTGEFTPPGVTCSARANHCADSSTAGTSTSSQDAHGTLVGRATTDEQAVTRMTTLGDEEIGRWLEGHAAWRREGDAIRRDVECSSFPAAIELVRAIAEVAEQRDHHPDIDIRWRTLHIALSTHSEGGVTAKDTALAETIDGLAAAG